MSERPSMPTWHDPVQLCLRGLRDASERLGEVQGTDDELATAAAITEAVMWCCSLDELWWHDPEYGAVRDADEDGRLIPGLRWARNRGIHEVVALHNTTGGRSYPMRFPLRYRTVSWRLTADDARPGYETYRAHLQGQQVWSTVASAERFLIRIAEQKVSGRRQSAPR